MIMADTIFSKILKKEIPNYTVYEDEHVLAFLDIHPHAKGHTLVIPKKEVVFIGELSEQEVATLFVGVQKTIKKIQEVLNPDGFNVGWNHGKAGGQAVDHVHVHILPRWKGDGGGSQHSVISNPGNVSVKDIAALFSS